MMAFSLDDTNEESEVHHGNEPIDTTEIASPSTHYIDGMMSPEQAKHHIEMIQNEIVQYKECGRHKTVPSEEFKDDSAPGFFSNFRVKQMNDHIAICTHHEEPEHIKEMRDYIAICNQFYDTMDYVLAIEDVDKFLATVKKIDEFDTFFKQRGH